MHRNPTTYWYRRLTESVSTAALVFFFAANAQAHVEYYAYVVPDDDKNAVSVTPTASLPQKDIYAYPMKNEGYDEHMFPVAPMPSSALPTRSSFYSVSSLPAGDSPLNNSRTNSLAMRKMFTKPAPLINANAKSAAKVAVVKPASQKVAIVPPPARVAATVSAASNPFASQPSPGFAVASKFYAIPASTQPLKQVASIPAVKVITLSWLSTAKAPPIRPEAMIALNTMPPPASQNLPISVKPSALRVSEKTSFVPLPWKMQAAVSQKAVSPPEPMRSAAVAVAANAAANTQTVKANTALLSYSAQTAYAPVQKVSMIGATGQSQPPVITAATMPNGAAAPVKQDSYVFATKVDSGAANLGALAPASGSSMSSPGAGLLSLPGAQSPAVAPSLPQPAPWTASSATPSTVVITPATPMPLTPAAITPAPVTSTAITPAPVLPSNPISPFTPPAIVSSPLTPLSSATAPDNGISRQSQHIVDTLPPERPLPQHVKPITMSHVQKNPLEEDPEVKKHDGVGISISVRQPKKDISQMLENAYDALIQGNQEEAIGLYKDVLASQPNNKLALFGLATTYHRAGQIQMARPLYGRLLAIDPHNVEGLNNFLVLLADESPNEALVELERLEQTHPGFSPIPAQMAIIYEKEHNYALAVQKMQEAIDLSPENIKYQYDMAIMLDRRGDWADAATYYQQLLVASERGEKIPFSEDEIQERLTFIRSNTPKG